MHIKRFELKDIKRIPVEISNEAQSIIDASHQQGRLLPLALSEHFGAMGTVESITIDVTDEALLSVKVRYNNTENAFLINLRDIQELHEVTRIPTVQARSIAQEIVKLAKAR